MWLSPYERMWSRMVIDNIVFSEEMSAATLTVAMLPYLSYEYEKAYNTADPLEIAVRIYNDILDRFSGVNSQK